MEPWLACLPAHEVTMTLGMVCRQLELNMGEEAPGSVSALNLLQ